jgi:hypothetical protein
MTRKRLVVLAATAAAAAVATVGLATPAGAATPDRFGFVLWNGGAVVPSGTTPAATIVIPGPPGRYRIIFPGQAASGGVVHVTAINDAPHWCQADGWGVSGADEIVAVSCYKVGGVLDPVAFSAIFSRSSGPLSTPGGLFGYIDANPAGTLVSQYNPSGALNTVSHGVVGQYVVTMPGLGTPGPVDGSVEATAVSPSVPARCKIAKLASSPAAQRILVLCFNAAGVPFDTRFTLTYQFQRSLYGGARPPKSFGYVWNVPPTGPPSTNFNSFLGSGVNTITPAGTGLSLVQFPQLVLLPDNVQVTAFGSGSEFCSLLTFWVHSGSALIVRDVSCYDNAGVRANSGFFIAAHAAI